MPVTLVDMHQVFFLARIYPYWALPSALISGQLGIYFRRRRNKAQHLFWLLIATLVLSSVAWIIFRGDLNSDDWIRTFFGS